MARKQSVGLEREKFPSDPILVNMVVVLLVFLTLFILYPLLVPLVDSFYPEGKTTLEISGRVLSLERFQKAFKNTLALGMTTEIASTAIGLPSAYVGMYVKLKTKILRKLFAMVSMLPIVSPPFALSLSMIMLLGRSGIITHSLLGIYDPNVYEFKRIATMQTLTSFSVCYLTLKGLLKNVDPSLEEATRDMEASRWKVLASVAFPLLLPGPGNVFLMTFIKSVADFANPMLTGGSHDTLATTIHLQVTGACDSTRAAAVSVVPLSLTVVLSLIQKYYLEKKTVVTLTGKTSHMRMFVEDKGVMVPLTFFCDVASAFVMLMYTMMSFGVSLTLWGKDYSLSLKWFQCMLKTNRLKAFKDFFVLSLTVAPPTALLSMVISYLVVEKRFETKRFVESVSMLTMAVPGIVLGIGYIGGYANGLFRTSVVSGLYGTGLTLTIVFIVRSLPTGAKSGISALRQIDKSIEESVCDMGANSARVLMTVTPPLAKDSFFNGLVTAFVRSITAISAIILLTTSDFLLIICQINGWAEKRNYGMACAYATVLITITYDVVLIMNTLIKFFGVSRRIKQGD